jgi:hypothetical protein
MKLLLSFSLILSLSSCSTFKGGDSIDYSESYVTGQGTEFISSEVIRKNLLREKTMAGGNYDLKVFPITKAYINSFRKEFAAGRNFTTSQTKRLFKSLNEKYITSKACMDVNITIKEFEKVNKLENWKLTLIDSKNIVYSLRWLPEAPSNISLPMAIGSQRNTYHGKETMWFLAGRACASADLELRKGFKLVFRPSFVQWPFEDEQKIAWSFNYTEIIDGKKVLKKKKEKKKEGYRGW